MTVVPPGSETKIELPQGWTVASGQSPLAVIGPENDLRMEFIEIPRTGEVEEIAQAAWRSGDPEFNLAVLNAVRAPAEDGWETVTQISYQTPAAESRSAVAIVRTLEGRAYVNLITGSKAAFGRRIAQVIQMLQGWKPASLKSTSLADRERTVWGPDQSARLGDFIRTSMDRMKIPGVSVAIVENLRVVFAEGFGRKRVGDDEAVAPTTPFKIGSSTKSLTTLMMARLVERGVFTWETPVVDILKDFALGDPDLTSKLQMRHTVCACTGMPRRDLDFIFKYAGITPEQRLAEMRTMRPTTGFGETFQYSNLLVAAGGYAAARAFAPDLPLETAYERVMQELVFDPLRMTHSTFRHEDAVRLRPALPHAINFDGECEEIALEREMSISGVAPAGAAWSTAIDMARYLQLELGNGETPDGERVISETALARRRSPEIKIGEKSSYGLGLLIDDEQGIPLMGHGGNTLGFSADMWFLPTKNLAAVVLANVYVANYFLAAVRQKIFEIVFEAAPRAESMIASAVTSRADNQAKMHARIKRDAAAMATIAAMAGNYESEELGPARIVQTDGAYRIEFESWGSDLGVEQEQSGAQLLVLTSPPFPLRLQLAPDGRELILDAAQAKYTFRKV